MSPLVPMSSACLSVIGARSGSGHKMKPTRSAGMSFLLKVPM